MAKVFQLLVPDNTKGSRIISCENKIWLICYDKTHFDVEGCFKKYGQIYWTHRGSKVNVQKGDIAYLYSNSPESAIRFKVEIVDSQMPYSHEMDVEDEFAKDETNSDDQGEKFFLVRPIAETRSPALTLPVLQSKRLMGKRAATTILSNESFKNLREYIEKHFDDSVSTEGPIVSVSPKPAKPKQAKLTKEKIDRRPPFKFSMIGLKKGDVIYFEYGNIPVKVLSDNTIEYKGEAYTLSRFCKKFMPIEDSEHKEFRGPAHFFYQGKLLSELRVAKEKDI